MVDVSKSALHEFTVSPQANTYIEHYLQAGVGIDDGHPFTDFLLKHLNIAAGTVTTLMPDNVNPDDLLHFSAARMGDIGNITGREMIELVPQYLASDPDALCVFEDRLGRKGDPGGTFEDTVWFVGSIPYYFLRSEHASDVERIRGLMRELDFYFFFGTLIQLPAGYTVPPPGAELTLDQLETFAQHTQYLIWSAYDDAGALLWHHPSVAPPPTD